MTSNVLLLAARFVMPPVVAGLVASAIVAGADEERWILTWIVISIAAYLLVAIAVRVEARLRERRAH